MVATLARSRGVRYAASAHVGSILLTGSGGEVVPLDYRSQTSPGTDAGGNLESIKLALPPGTALPGVVRAYVILDVFPLAVRELQ